MEYLIIIDRFSLCLRIHTYIIVITNIQINHNKINIFFYSLIIKNRLNNHLTLKDLFQLNQNPFFKCTIGIFNPSKWTNADMCRMHGVTYETLMEDQENQIRGFIHYIDAAGMSLQQLTLFTPREAVRIVKNGEVK